jgi:hypothetical protein
MKKLFITLLLGLSLVSFSTSNARANDYRNLNTLVETSGFDTALHVGVGFGIAWLVHEYSGLDGWKADVASVLAATVFGLAKEATDKHPNGEDVLGYTAGAVAQIVIFRFSF